MAITMATARGLIVTFRQQNEADAARSEDDLRRKFEHTLNADLKRISEELSIVPPIKVSSWLWIVNGCAIEWQGITEDTLKQVEAKLRQLTYVKDLRRNTELFP